MDQICLDNNKSFPLFFHARVKADERNKKVAPASIKGQQESSLLPSCCPPFTQDSLRRERCSHAIVNRGEDKMSPERDSEEKGREKKHPSDASAGQNFLDCYYKSFPWQHWGTVPFHRPPTATAASSASSPSLVITFAFFFKE